MEQTTLIIRWIFIVVNGIIWFCGAICIGIGLWLSLYEDAFDILGIINPEEMNYFIWRLTVYTMVGVGCVVFVTGFLGIYGAGWMVKNVLLAYCLLSVICIAGEMCCVVLAMIYRNDINALESKMFQDITTKYTTVDQDNPYVLSWNRFQSLMHCCGSYDFTDWHSNPNYDPTNYATVPWTCCKMIEVHDPPLLNDVFDEVGCYDEGIGSDPESQPGFHYLNTKGCHEALAIWMEDVSTLIYATTLILVFLQFGVLVTGCMLYCGIRKGQ